MKELRYQQKAVDELVSKTIDLMGLKGSRNALIFKSPTGSGKTVMASEMLGRLNQELTERPDAPFTQAAYIWIAPNKLHEQSYFKMKNRFTENCALHPVIFDELDHSADGYIKPGEILFVNWESINKDNNIMVRETEYMASLYDITRRTQCDHGIPHCTNYRRGTHVRRQKRQEIRKSARHHTAESGNPYFCHPEPARLPESGSAPPKSH